MNQHGIQDFFLSAWAAPLLASDDRVYWLYLLTALVAARVSFRLYGGAARAGGFKAFLRYCFPKGVYNSPSALTDYFLFFVRPFFLVMMLVPLALTAGVCDEATSEMLEWAFGTRESQLLSTADLIFSSVMLFLAFDFAQFLMHYLAHRVWFLWEFHKIHHSAQVLIPLTAYRFHPIDDLMSYFTVGSMTGTMQGLLSWHYGHPRIEPYTFMGMEVGLFLFYLAAYNLRHSQVWLPYPKAISHILVSPSQHQIHHSNAQPHWDKNMGFVFAFWDWMFGTLYVPKDREEIVYGLAGGEDAEYQSPVTVFTLPFIKIYRRLDLPRFGGHPNIAIIAVGDRDVQANETGAENVYG